MKALQKVIIGYARYISTLPVESKLPEQALAELAALREAGEKMAKIYTHLPKEIRNESNVYYQILLSGVEAVELMTALEAWEAANK